MRKILLICLLFLSLSTPVLATDVTWADKETGGSFSAADANEVKTAVNSKANLSHITWVTATVYTANNTMVAYNGHVFVCTVNHTAGSTTEPGVGASWETVWKYHGSDLYLSSTGTAADSDKLGGVAAADYQLSLGTVGTAGLYPIEETALGVTGKGIVGNWKMFYSNAAGGNFEQFDIGTAGYSLVSQGTAGAPQWLIRPQTITCSSTDKISAFDITTGLFTCSADEEGLGGSDASAIHDDTAGEIAAITEKTTPVSADLIVIEDSAASNAKKRVQIGNLPGGSTVTLGTDVAPIFSLTGQQLDLDSQTANYIFAAPNGSAGDPTFRAMADADIPSAIARDSELPTAGSLSVDDLITLSGVATGAMTLGTFTGGLIDDSLTVKAALQDIETSVEAKLPAGADGEYGLWLTNNTVNPNTYSTGKTGFAYYNSLAYFCINGTCSAIGTNPMTASGDMVKGGTSGVPTRMIPGTGVVTALEANTNGAGGFITHGNAAGTAAVLTGYSSGAGVVAATDTILQAVNKLNGNTAAKIGGSTGSTDNAILRADGTGGSTAQTTGVTIDDNNNLSTAGTISGKTAIVVNSATASYSVTLAEARANTLFLTTNTATTTYTLPAAEAGLAVCFKMGQGNSQVLRLDTDGTDYLVMSTGARTSAAGDYYGATASATNKICAFAYDTTDWYTEGGIGTWAEE